MAIKASLEEKICLACGSIFKPSRCDQKYCPKLDCQKERNRRLGRIGYYRRREKALERAKRYYSENRERIIKHVREYYRSRNFGLRCCEQCGKDFQAWRQNQKFCSKPCQEKYWTLTGIKTRLKGRDERTRALGAKGRANQVFPLVGTRIEKMLSRALKVKGLNIQCNYNIGNHCNADIAIPDNKIAIFCDGDYWHRRDLQIKRDKRVTKRLKNAGWHVLRFWEFEIRDSLSTCVEEIVSCLKRG